MEKEGATFEVFHQLAFINREYKVKWYKGWWSGQDSNG